MRNCGLTESLPWPQDEIADDNSSQANGDTPLVSLDVSVIEIVDTPRKLGITLSRHEQGHQLQQDARPASMVR